MSQIVVGGLVHQMHVLSLLDRCTSDEVVEDMGIPLSGWGSGHVVVFQVVVESLDARQLATVGEL